MAKMASRYSIKSALSKWTRAKAKVRVVQGSASSYAQIRFLSHLFQFFEVWKLNLQQVQSWLHGEGQGAPEVATAASRWGGQTVCFSEPLEHMGVRPCEEAPSVLCLASAQPQNCMVLSLCCPFLGAQDATAEEANICNLHCFG